MLQRGATLLAGVLLGLLSAALLTIVSSRPRGHAVELSLPPTPEPLWVHVCGAVSLPGVYQLPPGSILQQAVDAAGGPTSSAEMSTLNLASQLRDGQQVYVPKLDEPLVPITSGSTSANPGLPEQLVNINTASASELDLLPGIGPSLAQKIIEHRETYGPFTSIDDLINVSGIGPAKLEDLRHLITIR
jgi:competence protein ComEA